MKSVVEEVLNLHFDEIELVVVLKSLHVGKYFDKILGTMPPPQYASRMDEFRVKFQKMLETCFHVRQIARYVLRITKIYSLLCLWCMVKEILAKGQPKVKWGQIFNNIRFTCTKYQIVHLAVYMTKIYAFT